uniref:DUF4503 domain-containing protein n=1 Tax=Timema monikensis TaxID=170555 RepID=A0A7R9EGP9_9NEOP|nr:unnamed protein product [Timema monikensis]
MAQKRRSNSKPVKCWDKCMESFISKSNLPTSPELSPERKSLSITWDSSQSDTEDEIIRNLQVDLHYQKERISTQLHFDGCKVDSSNETSLEVQESSLSHNFFRSDISSLASSSTKVAGDCDFIMDAHHCEKEGYNTKQFQVTNLEAIPLKQSHSAGQLTPDKIKPLKVGTTNSNKVSSCILEQDAKNNFPSFEICSKSPNPSITKTHLPTESFNNRNCSSYLSISPPHSMFHVDCKSDPLRSPHFSTTKRRRTNSCESADSNTIFNKSSLHSKSHNTYCEPLLDACALKAHTQSEDRPMSPVISPKARKADKFPIISPELRSQMMQLVLLHKKTSTECTFPHDSLVVSSSSAGKLDSKVKEIKSETPRKGSINQLDSATSTKSPILSRNILSTQKSHFGIKLKVFDKTSSAVINSSEPTKLPVMPLDYTGPSKSPVIGDRRQSANQELKRSKKISIKNSFAYTPIKSPIIDTHTQSLVYYPEESTHSMSPTKQWKPKASFQSPVDCCKSQKHSHYSEKCYKTGQICESETSPSTNTSSHYPELCGYKRIPNKILVPETPAKLPMASSKRQTHQHSGKYSLVTANKKLTPSTSYTPKNIGYNPHFSTKHDVLKTPKKDSDFSKMCVSSKDSAILTKKVKDKILTSTLTGSNKKINKKPQKPINQLHFNSPNVKRANEQKVISKPHSYICSLSKCENKELDSPLEEKRDGKNMSLDIGHQVRNISQHVKQDKLCDESESFKQQKQTLCSAKTNTLTGIKNAFCYKDSVNDSHFVGSVGIEATPILSQDSSFVLPLDSQYKYINPMDEGRLSLEYSLCTQLETSNQNDVDCCQSDIYNRDTSSREKLTTSSKTENGQYLPLELDNNPETSFQAFNAKSFRRMNSKQNTNKEQLVAVDSSMDRQIIDEQLFDSKLPSKEYSNNSSHMFPNTPKISTVSKDTKEILSTSIVIESVSSQELISTQQQISPVLQLEPFNTRIATFSPIIIQHWGTFCVTSCIKEIIPVLSQEMKPENVPTSDDTSNAHTQETHCLSPVRAGVLLGCEAIDMDSAKKKQKRYKKDSFSARLQKLLTRQKSTANIWQYELNKQTPNCDNKESRNTLLTVRLWWTEFGRVLIRCSRGQGLMTKDREQDDSSTFHEGNDELLDWSGISSNGTNTVSADVIIVLDPSIVQLPKLLPKSVIRIYPPWQVMEMPQLGVSMVLCLTHVEIVRACCSIPTTIERAHTLVEFNCACLKEKERSIRLNHKCSFNFPDRGREFMEHIFSTDCSEYPSAITRPTSQTVDVDVNNNSGTIADAVNNYDCVLSGNIWLLICVERIFQCRQTRFKLNTTESQHSQHGSQTDSRNVAWSMIGRDLNGEYCEVILGSAFSDIKSKPSSLSIQEESKAPAHPTVGNIHTKITPGIWTLLNSITESIKPQTVTSPGDSNISERSCTETQPPNNANQLFFYMFSTSGDTWDMSEHVTEHQTLCSRSVKHPHITSLADVLKQCCSDQYLRRTILVKVLHTRHDRLYVLDTSLDPGSPCYVVVMVKSLCYLPFEVIHGKSVVIILQDVLCHKGSLLADKYTQISLAKNSHDVITLLDKDALTSLQSLKPAIPHLKLSTTDNEIITLTGDYEEIVPHLKLSTTDNEIITLTGESEEIVPNLKLSTTDNEIITLTGEYEEIIPNLKLSTTDNEIIKLPGEYKEIVPHLKLYTTNNEIITLTGEYEEIISHLKLYTTDNKIITLTGEYEEIVPHLKLSRTDNEIITLTGEYEEILPHLKLSTTDNEIITLTGEYEEIVPNLKLSTTDSEIIMLTGEYEEIVPHLKLYTNNNEIFTLPGEYEEIVPNLKLSTTDSEIIMLTGEYEEIIPHLKLSTTDNEIITLTGEYKEIVPNLKLSTTDNEIITLTGEYEEIVPRLKLSTTDNEIITLTGEYEEIVPLLKLSTIDNEIIMLTGEYKEIVPHLKLSTTDNEIITLTGEYEEIIPHLKLSITDNEIIMLTGNVVGVDEDTAFAWPSCALCNNELLAELPGGRYFCNKCDATIPTITNMSLAIYVASLLIPLHCIIKVQLMQETIMGLLTPSISGVEGYDLTSLLGQEIGPLLCLVVQTRTSEDDNTGFLLEQLPAIE